MVNLCGATAQLESLKMAHVDMGGDVSEQRDAKLLRSFNTLTAI
jgi:hypothetical protein